MSVARSFGALVFVFLAGSGCAAAKRHDPPAADDGVAAPCTAADSTTRNAAMADPFAGDYRLTMIATSGDRTGHSVSGTLTFDGQVGHAAIALATVGAVAAGDIGSRDPNRPGVLLVRSPNDSTGTPMLRFGADANRSDIRAFDSAYLVMPVDAVTEAGFSGRWRSGVGTAMSGGYFCAARRLSGALGAPRRAESHGLPSYTIAFKSFAPNNTDIFIADADGSHAHALAPDPALDYDASFSSDGAWIVFTSHRSGRARIYRVRPDGTGLEPLTDGSSFSDQGTLSPDGRTLAFVSSRSGQTDIWLLDLATRTLRNLTSHAAGDFRPAWAPDGQSIAFSSDRDPPRAACPNTTAPGPGPFVTPQYLGVYIVRRDGSSLRRISGPNETAGTPRWSPDGKRVAFWTGDPDQVCRGGLILGTGTTQIASVDVTTGARETMTSGEGLKIFPHWRSASRIAYQTRETLRITSVDSTFAGEFGAPDWSPDHRLMVFHREVDPRGDRDRPFESWPSLDTTFGLLRVPDASSFSPAGDRLVYVLTNFAGSVRNGTLIVANADGSNRRAIYAGPVTQDMTGPAWSPKGDAIAFGSGGFFQRAQFQSAQLMTVGVDGTGLSRLTSDTANSGMPSWSPDGREVVFRRATGLKRNLYVLNVATGASRKLETGSDFDTFPSWSPRGDWIAFTSKRDGDYEIYRIHPDGTGLERLTRSPGNDAHPAFSPDGEWIAFATARQGFKDEAIQLLLSATFQPYGEIAVMRVDGSALRLLTDNSTEEGAPSWRSRRRP